MSQISMSKSEYSFKWLLNQDASSYRLQTSRTGNIWLSSIHMLLFPFFRHHPPCKPDNWYYLAEGSWTVVMWHLTRDAWHVTHETCQYVSRETQGVVNILSKVQVPISHCLRGIMFWILGGKRWMKKASRQGLWSEILTRVTCIVAFSY